jgi:hypothetical protein
MIPSRVVAGALVLAVCCFASGPGAQSRPSGAPASRDAGAATAGDKAQGKPGSAFSQEQIEQMVAPIALYPDGLLMQIMMSATYPLEVVSAERWIVKNPSLTGKALEEALKAQTWDAAVKSLCGFPRC